MKQKTTTTDFLTVKEYAKKRKVSIPAASRAIKIAYDSKSEFPCKSIPGVTSIRKVGREYLIIANAEEITKFRNKKYAKK